MVTIETELIEAKKDERGRRITTRAERKAIVRAYWESGLTQRAFDEREGVKYVTFTAWAQEFRDQKPGVEAPKFAEVKLPQSRGWRAGGGAAPTVRSRGAGRRSRC